MFDRIVDLLSRIGLVLGSALLVGMTLLTAIDVVLRYVFSAPLPSSAEMIQLMLSLTVFLGLILVSRDGSHIVVSLFEPALNRLSPRLYTGVYAVTSFAGTAFLLWVMVLAARDSYLFEDTTEAMEIPFVWILAVLAVCVGFALIACMSVFTKGISGHGSAD